MIQKDKKFHKFLKTLSHLLLMSSSIQLEWENHKKKFCPKCQSK